MGGITNTSISTSTIAVGGMTCGACTSAVERALSCEGVTEIKISLLAGRVVVKHAAVVTAGELAARVEDAGFDAHVLSSSHDGEGERGIGCNAPSIQLQIHGLGLAESLSSAASALQQSLLRAPGVGHVRLDLDTQTATISYTRGSTTARAIIRVIEDAGYGALLLDTARASAQLESLRKTAEIQQWKRAFWLCLIFTTPIVLISMLPMALPSAAWGGWNIIPGLPLNQLVCGALIVPVQFGLGRKFYVSAWKSVRSGSLTMDVLVVVGTSAAFFFSCLDILVAVILVPHSTPATLFDASAMLITFITLGRWLEIRARGQTSAALSKLMSLTPSMATVYEDSTSPLHSYEEKDDGEVMERLHQRRIPTELIEVDDLVLLRPGDKVPADGLAIDGESWVDESMVTGEATPVLKTRDSLVLAGTVNGNGQLRFRVTRAGKETRLSQMVELVHEAQSHRAPIQRLADTMAGYFVPTTLVLGLMTSLGWTLASYTLTALPEVLTQGQERSGGRVMLALTFGISVIVYACPCALGLATPTAIMVGTGVASQHGLLIKGGGVALEAANSVTHVVFDKTGTLTWGQFRVSSTSIEPHWMEKSNLWWMLASLAESGSEHPVGQAIVSAARDRLQLGAEGAAQGRVDSFQASVGQGVEAEVVTRIADGDVHYRVLLGNSKYLMSHGIAVPASRVDEQDAVTLVYMSINGLYAGTIGLSDTLKPTARAAITALHRLGLTTSLVTGDNQATAATAARQVGIPRHAVHANVTPEGKKIQIARLREAGHIVAMVGDGINDSPALAAADVGVALMSGSDVAVEAADIVAMHPDDLLSIVVAFVLSRSILARIRANLAWACGYNVLGLPLAMGLLSPWGILLPPVVAGAAMALSSISVTLCSLTLRWWKRPEWLNCERLEADLSQVDASLDVPPSEADFPLVGMSANKGRAIGISKIVQVLSSTLRRYRAESKNGIVTRLNRSASGANSLDV